MSEEPRIAPNGNRLPERLPIGHRLVDITKQQWLIGPTIGCGGFGDIYLTKQYNEKTDHKLTRDQLINESASWTNVIKFEHFSGPLFAEINFYLRVAKKRTIEEYMKEKNLKHLGMPRFIASGIYDPARTDNPAPICKDTPKVLSKGAAAKRPAAKKVALKKGVNGVANGNGIVRKKVADTKDKKYRFLVLQRFGDDVYKIWLRANSRFDMTSAFSIALKVLDTLEYIHSHGYVHADVKACNLLVEWDSKYLYCLANGDPLTRESSVDSGNGSLEDRKIATTKKVTAVKRKRPSSITSRSNGVAKEDHPRFKNYIDPTDQIYLIDFGLVEKYESKEGEHREYVEDQRRANNGTVEFSSRDAHIGAFSRRSDLESLAYNLLYWMSGGRLPWCHIVKDHSSVEVLKKWYMNNLEVFINYCFNEDATPVDAAQLLKEATQFSMITNGRHSNSNITKKTAITPKTVTKKSSTHTSAIPAVIPASTRLKKSDQLQRATAVTNSKSNSLLSANNSSTKDSITSSALYEFISYIARLDFKAKPDYKLLKTILSNALNSASTLTLSDARLTRLRNCSFTR